MSSEIVLTEPIHENEIATHDEAESSEAASRRAYTRSITYGHDRGQYVPEQFDSERLPVTLGSEIRRFLRVANQIELEEPRVAYLCMWFFCSVSIVYYAFTSLSWLYDTRILHFMFDKVWVSLKRIGLYGHLQNAWLLYVLNLV